MQKSILKKSICLLIAILMVSSLFCMSVLKVNNTVQAAGNKNYNGLKVAYIPIDNRPVNLDRVIYLAKSVGIQLMMPDEDLFRTALDNMTPNKNGTSFGDRKALLDWLKEVDKTCDYFVLSLDQLLSGGLVSSRWLDNTDLGFEYEIADFIINLAENNTVVLFDTVMRLASTVNYQNYQMNEYTKLREYGSVARKTLEGDDLTVNNIIAGYRYGTNGNKISTSLSNSAIDKYLASRTRKLKLIDYILSQSLDDLEFCYIGVDDSSTSTNIQTNEINYISNKLGDNGALYAGTDELGLMGLTRIVTKLYGTAKIGVTYYGGGENKIADAYDFATLKYEIENHISSLGCTISDDADIQALIFTSGGSVADAEKLVNDAYEYIENRVPVIIIDPNTNTGSAVEKELLKRSFPITMLLGYSNWNTAANAMGIALCNGISRYTYLTNCSNITKESHEGFLQAATFGYLKDISYKYFGYSIDNPTATGTGSYTQLLKMINSNLFISSLSPYRVLDHENVSVDNFHYPWDRTFEMSFDITVDGEICGTHGDMNDDGIVRMNDYILAKRLAAGTVEATKVSTARCDLNGNGNIDEDDLLMIKRHFLGKEIIK